MQTGNDSPNPAAFEAESGIAPVVNVSGADAPTATELVSSENTSKFFTEEDLSRVRSQEKDKLYPQIENLKSEIENLKKEKAEEAARLAADAEAKAAELAAIEKAKLEEDLSAKDLLKIKEQEWQEQLERERQERERAFALLEREKAFADLQNYKQIKLEQERDNIMPELLDLLGGNTPEEIDASVEGLKERSARIFESAQAAMQTTRREMVGTRVTTPPAGPLETNSEQRQFTAQDIASMSMEDYAKNRSRFLSNTAQGKTKGMF